MKEIELLDPYAVPYKGIYAICNEDNTLAEIIEDSNCYGGAAWSRYHYSHSPLILNTRVLGNMNRFLVKTGCEKLNLIPSSAAAGIEAVEVKGSDVKITYAGLGGGGVGATRCRAMARGVLNTSLTKSGGGRAAKGTIVVPRRERVLIGIDDTDTKDEGATWCLTHNIAHCVDSLDSVYLSQSLVQLYPVSAKTQNCVSTVLEFGCVNKNAKKELLESIRGALEKYSVSGETGMVALSSFEAREAYEYSKLCRSGELTHAFAKQYAEENGIEIWMDGNGLIGALAAIAWFARPDESVIMDAEIL
ncbi:methanogenesis marker protein 11 [Methanohalophilus sp.]|uniref:methanogenesis marker protein 11 n=1 Tax=Methanohalophilus sp. TaxID=1966352 RepID=UPI00263626AD|nr:methanogenesis marker protein 11 [Methanohalophilus sp.]